MELLLAVVVTNAVLAAIAYVDVMRSGHSPWWLVVFWVAGYPAFAAYLYVRVRESRRGRGRARTP